MPLSAYDQKLINLEKQRNGPTERIFVFIGENIKFNDKRFIIYQIKNCIEK